MTTTKKLSLYKIGSSAQSNFNLMIFLILCWFIIQSLIFALMDEWQLNIGTIIFLVQLALTFKFYTFDIETNESYIVFDPLTKLARALDAGFHLRVPWEKMQGEKINLKAEIKSDIAETFPTKDGSIKVKGTLVSRAPQPKEGQSEYSRSKEMILFYNMQDAVKGMQEATLKETVRVRVASEKTDEVIAKGKDKIVSKDDFVDITLKTSAEILKCSLPDLDYSDEIQKSKDKLYKAETLNALTKELLKEHTPEEAKERAMYLMEESNWKKEVKENNYNLSPKMLDILEKFFSKLF